MIGFLEGEVLFSDGNELILRTNSGVGYEIHFNRVWSEGSAVSLFISHIVKETSEDLYGFQSLREKKLFELFLTVKGVGPKSAYALVGFLSVDDIVNAIILDNKKLLTSAPGIGTKAASQIILDLSGKIQKIKMYTDKGIQEGHEVSLPKPSASPTVNTNDRVLIEEAIMACKELGFKEEKILPLAQKIVMENSISKAEQLVHLVLKEL